MLHANIKIRNIDYKKTLSTTFPVLKDYIGKSESGHPIMLLLKKLGDKTLSSILLKIMQNMSDDTKDELMTVCLNTYSSTCVKNSIKN